MISLDKIKKMNGMDEYNNIISSNNYKKNNNYNNFVVHHKSNPVFPKCEIGDYIKFKSINNQSKDKMREGVYVENKYSVYFGKVTDISSPSLLGVNVDSNDKRLDFPTGITIKIDRRAVLQIYPHKLIEHLTPRIALKHLWKDLVFREIKTTKCESRDLKYVQYHYINKSGFVRIKRFRTLDQALSSVDPKHHKNITVHYAEYYGFTFDKAIRNNDKYFDREIFFSKKCYGELDFTDKTPTGDFLLNERGFNDIPPRPGSLVCGLVENGEKGLFFRKWSICSREFLQLWTMICDIKDHSLKSQRTNKIKPINELIEELNTNFYSPDLEKSVVERQEKYIFHNLERTALFYPNRYKSVCDVLFGNNFIKENTGRSYSDDYKDDLTPFQKRLIKNIMWPERLL